MTEATSGTEKFLEFLGGIPKFVVKHPVITAGTVGVGAGILASRKKARELEASLQHERMGSPSAMYSYAELEEFAEKKAFLEIKCAYEKTAADYDKVKSPGGSLSEGFFGGIGRATGEAGISDLRRLVGAGAQSIKEKVFTDPKRRSLFRSLLKNDPDIAMYESERPGQLQKAYSTMSRFAPTLSTDPNVVSSFLREFAFSGAGGNINHVTLKGLAEAESAVQRAKNEGAWGKDR